MPKPDPQEVAGALKLFAEQKIVVRVPKRTKAGEPVRDAETQKFVTEDQPLAAAHVLGLRVEDDAVVIVTVDGQKYRALKPAAK